VGNIVLCCDGTSNEFSENNTNVVKLYQMLVRDSPGTQISFYSPGVGTFASRGALLPISKRISRVLGLAIGVGLMANVEEGYTFLMNSWSPGDSVYLFGFSRGAYTARALAAMLNRCGLLLPGHENLVPYASKVFADTSRASWKVAEQFKETFGRPVRIRFLGLWDTVSSVGWAWNPKTLPFTSDNSSVDIVRHALAIDERRAFFRQNSWTGVGDVKQVWFAGVHCDVGGSLPDERSGLSQIALEWLIKEAEQAGLRLDSAARARIFQVKRDHTIIFNDSLKGWWKLAEFYPKLHRKKVGPKKFKTELRPNLFGRRTIHDGAVLHESVVKRLVDVPQYRPTNLPGQYTVEPW